MLERTSIIQLRDIEKSFAGERVIKNLSLDIYEKEIVYIIGQSGTGKSVLLKIITALLKPDRGTVTIYNKDLFKISVKELIKIRKRMGVLFQYAALFDSMSVFDNVAFLLRRFTKMSFKEIEKIVRDKLELVGLGDVYISNISELSSGIKKRVALARTLILQPDIILYDEPTTGVDPISRTSIDELIRHINQTLGVVSIVVSHDIQSTFNIADRVVMLYKGDIIESGSTDVFQKTKNSIVQNFIQGKSEEIIA